jgi:hypothetical protein
MSKIKPHCFGQVCAVELCKGVLGVGKLAGVRCRGFDVGFLARLTLNPETGIRECVETPSDYRSASEFLAKDTSTFAFLVNIDVGR